MGGGGNVNQLTCILISLTASYQDVAAQSRVRRLIGRRRAGLDRYIGVLSREVGSGGQDNIDPITELLTQLSGVIFFVCVCLMEALSLLTLCYNT